MKILSIEEILDIMKELDTDDVFERSYLWNIGYAINKKMKED